MTTPRFHPASTCPSRTLAHIVRRYPVLSHLVPEKIKYFPLACVTSSPILGWALKTVDEIGDRILTEVEVYVGVGKYIVADEDNRTNAPPPAYKIEACENGAQNTTKKIESAVGATADEVSVKISETEAVIHKATDRLSMDTRDKPEHVHTPLRIHHNTSKLLTHLLTSFFSVVEFIRRIQIRKCLRHEGMRLRHVVVGVSRLAVEYGTKLQNKLKGRVQTVRAEVCGMVEEEATRERRWMEPLNGGGGEDEEFEIEMGASSMVKVVRRVLDRVLKKMVVGLREGLKSLIKEEGVVGPSFPEEK